MSNKQTKTDREGLLTIEEAADFLDLSKSYLYKLTKRGEIPHYKPRGKKIFFRKMELWNHVLQGKVAPEGSDEPGSYLSPGEKIRNVALSIKGIIRDSVFLEDGESWYAVEYENGRIMVEREYSIEPIE